MERRNTLESTQTQKTINKMTSPHGSKKNIFQEAIDHCRWKKTLQNHVLVKSELQEHNLYQFADKNFNEIFRIVYNICDKVKGIGLLTIYDISSAICRFNKINIDKIYIIGAGPKKAIRLLDVKAKSQKIDKITLKYVEISEILEAFQKKNYKINLQIKNSNNGDDFETYICKWQKLL